MKKIKIDSTNKIDKQSPDLRQEMLDKLKKLYPPLFDNEGMLNQEELEQLVSDFSTPQTEKYEFNWAGKQQSKKKAFTSSKATLRSDEKRSVDFDKTENLIIEGDNLEVLKLLQKSYFGKIKCIYIDPPYNTGNDFIYPDDYSEDKQTYWEKSGLKQNGIKLDTNTNSSGRYHSNWLSMMYPRLLLAHNLLKEDGVIFVSINDNEVHNLRKLMDEVFGEENFLALLVWENKEGGGSSDTLNFRIKHEYVLVFSKDIEKANIKGIGISNRERYNKKDVHFEKRGHFYLQKLGMSSIQYSESLDYPIKTPDGKVVRASENSNGEKACWRWSRKKFDWGIKNDFIVIKKDKNEVWTVYTKQYLKVDNNNNPIERSQRPMGVINEYSSTQGTKTLKSLFGELGGVFDYPKPVELINYLLTLVTEGNDIVLDFFAGSGTTAHAVMDLNKKDEGNREFILVQIPEATDEKSEAYKAGYKTISDICIERVKRAGKKLTESSKQQKLIDEGKDLDVGFKVFKLATSHFPENTFAPDPDKTDEENKKALEAYIKKATSQKGLFKDGVVDLVYEIALKDGFELTLKMDKVKDFDKNTVYKVYDSHKEAFICVDDSLEDATIKQLEDHKNERFICLHTSVNTTKKWNLQNILGSNLWLV